MRARSLSVVLLSALFVLSALPVLGGTQDFVLVNDDLDATEARLKTIIEATRLRRLQQPWLNDHVRKLQSEFEDMR